MKSHIITPVDAEKGFNKVLYLFMIKTYSKLGIEATFSI